MKARISNLESALDESEEARRALLRDLDETNDQVVRMEQELFESKSLQLELLDQLKYSEEQVDIAKEKLYQMA